MIDFLANLTMGIVMLLGILGHYVIVKLSAPTLRGWGTGMFHFAVFPGVMFCFVYYFFLVLPAMGRAGNTVRSSLMWITG